MEETEFALTDRFFPNFRRLFLTWMVPLFSILLLGLVYMAGSTNQEPFFIAVMACVFGGMIVYALRAGYQKQVQSFRDYRIVLSDRSIRRVQPGLPEIVIPRESVTRIVHRTGKGLAVTGASRHEVIGIPETLEGFAVVENALASWRPIEVRKAGGASGLLFLGMIAMFGAINLLYLSTNKVVVTIAGAALIAVSVYSMVELPKTRYLEERSKRTFRWIFPLSILGSVLMIWLAWTR